MVREPDFTTESESQDDPEARAIQELSRRMARLRTDIAVPVMLLGLLVGALLYGFLSTLQLASPTASFGPRFDAGEPSSPRPMASTRPSSKRPLKSSTEPFGPISVLGLGPKRVLSAG